MTTNTASTSPSSWGEALESFVGSGKIDAKGREIGFTVGLNDNGTDFAAWVQSARRTKAGFADFGVPQRSRNFATQRAATAWAYATARERIAKLK